MIPSNAEFENDDFIFHHIGLVVANIEESITHYGLLFCKGNSAIIYVESQKVKVCFVSIGNNSFIELVQPTDETSFVYKLLRKRVSYYHTGYIVKDIELTTKKLVSLNYKPLDFFKSEAFDGKRCIFLFSPEAHLIELIEA